MDDGLRGVAVRGISHSYGGVQALTAVDLEIRPGEVLALCGENGAGKSTLNRVLSGSLRPDRGAIEVHGDAMPLGSVAEAERRGIAIVHQEPTVFADLDASENIGLLRERCRALGLWLDKRAMRDDARSRLEALGESFPVDRPLSELGLAQRQMVAIARAVASVLQPLAGHESGVSVEEPTADLATGAKGASGLLILDEPTASLSQRESLALFGVVRALRDAGVAVLYVSHRLEEVFELADRVAVLRDGALVSVRPVGQTSRQRLVEEMVGRGVAVHQRPRSEFGATVLEVRGLGLRGAFEDVSLSVRSGEVVGLAGLVGAGRSEFARTVFGLERQDSGSVWIDGSVQRPGEPAKAIARGVALVPEDRQGEGLHLPMSIEANLSMASPAGLWIDRGSEDERAERCVRELAIRTPSTGLPASSLSGGNQQKVLLGKWLATDPRVLILDEPTRGIDVGAKSEVHRWIGELASRGVAVLLISSELPEVLALADRVVVMRQGRLAGEVSGDEATQERVLELALPRSEDVERERPRRAVGREGAVALVLLATVVGASLANPAFATAENLRDLLVRIGPAAIVGAGVTLVVLAREIDISVGSLMGLCGAVLGLASSSDHFGLPPAVAVALCLLVGVAGGALNGLLVAVGRVPSIIVTLGTLTVFRGITELLLGGKWIERMPESLRTVGTGAWAGVPYSVWGAAGVVLAISWLAVRTPFGRRVTALGSNPEAAVRIGLPCVRARLAVFSLTGLLVGVAALFGATQLQVVESGFGSGFELAVVAAVVVGGTSIRGGRGTVLGTVLGAALLGIVGTVLIFLRLGDSATFWERAIQGGFTLVAVLWDSLRHREVSR